jgi:hypothetical protein
MLPFVGLEPEEDGLLVREIPAERAHAHPRLLRDARRGEAARTLAGQNATSRFQELRDQLPGA